MANGRDKNGIRLGVAIAGFYSRYGSWPTSVRMPKRVIDELRQCVYTPQEFAAFEAKLRFVEDEGAPFIVEDEQGNAYTYGEDEPSPFIMRDISIRDWLGFPKLPEPRWLKRLNKTDQPEGD
jgi:hypothetical protein